MEELKNVNIELLSMLSGVIVEHKDSPIPRSRFDELGENEYIKVEFISNGDNELKIIERMKARITKRELLIYLNLGVNYIE